MSAESNFDGGVKARNGGESGELAEVPKLIPRPGLVKTGKVGQSAVKVSGGCPWPGSCRANGLVLDLTSDPARTNGFVNHEVVVRPGHDLSSSSVHESATVDLGGCAPWDLLDKLDGLRDFVGG
jgi:hypothetical protein